MTDDKFKVPWRVGYFDTDSQYRLLPQGLLLLLQELAISHSESFGASMDWLTQQHRGWAVAFWEVRIHQMPQYQQKLTLATWVPKIRKMQATRCYSVEDAQGQVLAEAMSLWIFLDLEGRCPTMLPQFLINGYHSDAPKAFDERFVLPKKPEGTEIGGHEFVVRRGETDANGHANNLRYVEWALEDVPDDLYRDGRLTGFSVIYRKECYRGSQVVTHTYRQDTPEGIVLHVFLTDPETEATLAQVRFTYQYC